MLDHPGSQVGLHDASQDAEHVEELVSTDVTRPPVNPQRGHNVLSETAKKKLIQRKIKERRIKQWLPLQALFEDDAKHPAHFVMKLTIIDIDSNLNVIAADRDIQNKIGRAMKIKL